MKISNPFSPIEIKFCSTVDFIDYLQTHTDSRMLIIISKSVWNVLGKQSAFSQFCKGENRKLIIGVKPNPSVTDICTYINELGKEPKYHTILAIGGGSCIDLAKAICALQGMARKSEITHAQVANAIAHKNFFADDEPSNIIAVPTTSGTGSEVTKWATVWDFVNKAKLSVTDVACFPKTAILVPELTVTMPSKVTLSTGLDALSHAMEACWAKPRNPLSHALALKAIELVRDNLKKAIDNPQDVKTRQNMCVASLTAGLAFSATRTTACHSISYPLTMMHNVPHGFACAITLESVKQMNAAAVDEIADIDNLFDNDFMRWLDGVCAGVISLKLSSFGIQQSDIDAIADSAFTLGRMDNNPVLPTTEQVKEILHNIL